MGLTKAGISGVCLRVALALLFLGFFVSCACPGWYAIGAAFAGVAVRTGTDTARKWAAACLIACLIGTIYESFSVLEEHRAFDKKVQRIRDLKSKAAPTNAQ